VEKINRKEREKLGISFREMEKKMNVLSFDVSLPGFETQDQSEKPGKETLQKTHLVFIM
jgi:hypothetical protein